MKKPLAQLIPLLARVVGAWLFSWQVRCSPRPAGCVVASSLLLGVGIALAAPGNLDPSFDGDGLLSERFGNREAGALAVVQQTDGKLVLAGWGSNSAGFMVARVAADGTPDTTFGSDGVTRVAFSEFSATPLAALQQTDGKVVLAGRADNPSGGDEDIALARFHADGTLDTSFGNGGKVTLDIGGSHDLAYGVIQQAGGKLVIAGGTISGVRYRGVFARFNANGALDTTFGNGGTTLVDFGGNTEFVANDIAQQSGGRLVAVGTVRGAGFDVGIARVTANGTLDPLFDGDGLLRIDISGNIDQAFAVAVQSDDAIVIAGATDFAEETSRSALLVRVNGDGSLDNSFGTAGRAVVDLGLDGYLRSMVAHADGKLVATGVRSTDVGGQDMILARFTSNGALDTSFGINGVATADFGTGNTAPESQGFDLIQQLDGKYVAVGPNNGYAFGAARFDDGAEFPGLIGLTATAQDVSETAATVTYTVRRTGGTSGAVSVHYATAAGQAQPSSDFEAASGTLTWNDGNANDKTLSINLINDDVSEADEDFSLTLSASTGGAQLAASKATTAIVSEDGPGQLEFSSAPQVLEAFEDFFSEAVGVNVPVRRTGGSTGAVSVTYSTTDGTATAGVDFVDASGTVTWADGDTGVKSVRIATIPDSAAEGNEEFRLRLSNPTGGATISPVGGTQVVRIRDNDDFGFALTRPNVSEAGRSVLLTVLRQGAADGAVSVNYATSNGTATAGTDFTSASGTLHWADGDSARKTIRIIITNDSIVEGNETFYVRLGGANFGLNSVAIVTILDDDAPGGGGGSTLGFAAIGAHLSEGSSVDLSVVRSGSSIGAVSVDYATSNGTATAGTDFTSASGTLSWADGDTANKTITIRTTNDATDESDETFSVTLSNPSPGTTLANSALTVTIPDDDAPASGGGTLEFVATASTGPEGTSFVLGVMRTGGSSGAVSVDYGASSGTATAGMDFTNASGTVNWADGDSAIKSIVIFSANDTTDESDEIFTVTLSNPSAVATLGANSTATMTLLDDDPSGGGAGGAGGAGGGGGGGGGGASADRSEGGGGSSDHLLLLGLLLLGLAGSERRAIRFPAKSGPAAACSTGRTPAGSGFLRRSEIQL